MWRRLTSSANNTRRGIVFDPEDSRRYATHMKKFKLDGVQSGWVRFTEDGRDGQLEFERLAAKYDMVIFVRRCFWITPSEERMAESVAERLIQEFADETGYAIELERPGGNSSVKPSS